MSEASTTGKRDTQRDSPRWSGSSPPDAGEQTAEVFSRFWDALLRIGRDYALLGVLDLRRSAVQLGWLVGAGIVIAVLVVTAWLAGVTALIAWMLSHEMPWPVALLAAAGLNLVGAVLVFWRMKEIFTEMPFAATLRQLKGRHAPDESTWPT